MPLTEAAQAVQRSAYPTAYRQWDADAHHLVSTLLAELSPESLDQANGAMPASGLCVTAGAVLARASTWLTAWHGGPVPYQTSTDPTTWFHGYRRDCSGYASMALGLPGPGLDAAALAARSHRISKNDLRAGDLLINPSPGAQGHVVIFDHWTSRSRTSYIGYEQSADGGTHHRRIPYPYFGTYQMQPFETRIAIRGTVRRSV